MKAKRLSVEAINKLQMRHFGVSVGYRSNETVKKPTRGAFGNREACQGIWSGPLTRPRGRAKTEQEARAAGYRK